MKKLILIRNLVELKHSIIGKEEKIIKLSFDDIFKQPLADSLNQLCNLQILTFGYKFNQLLANSLNNLHNLQILTFGYKFNQQLVNSLNNLCNLQSLTFGYVFNQQLGDSLNQLVNLQILIFGCAFNQPLANSLNQLVNLQSLTFGSYFNQSLGDNFKHLVNLQSLTFGAAFNQPLSNLPINLNKLTLSVSYGYDIPFGIKHLILNHNIKIIDYLPESIEELELYYDNEFDLINLPNSIIKLILRCPKVNSVISPKSVTYLKIYPQKLTNIKNIPSNTIIEYYDK